ncbi:uncharacterized protein LOC106156237 isoform X2 [Lingula anatina]|uniref:Uncharacterized protein LOC106156237 isoform X2 n=1 Tax=Lingula anatina TaxID=7574 RepID=A0A1S3HL72_LINAN|nr:uncharacterized protein LOC106156237 isoform X2 [Lingula anatina]|eukprot:XP_013386853.1 uncharacterized protein LOC106156237 isoform X2 [Lingula anatina]
MPRAQPLWFFMMVAVLPATTGKSFDGLLRRTTDGRYEAYMKPPYKSNHASFIERLSNEDMVIAWFSGSKEGESNVAIVFARLPNGTLQWMNPRTVSQRPGYSNQNPVLFADNNTLFLFHTQQKASFTSTCNSDVGSEDSAQVWALVSTDGKGEKFTKPKLVLSKAGSFDRNRIIRSLKNEWLFPTYFAGGSSKDQHSILMENAKHDPYSSWVGHAFPKSDYLVQPSVVRPVPGKPNLVVFFRDRRAGNIYRATSPDDGKTWTTPTKTTLPNNNSGIEANVLKSGRIALVYNPTHHARDPLVISLSEDQGKSWKYTRTLETSSSGKNVVEYSYPSLLQDTMARIHVSYTYNRETVKHVIIPNEQWIMKTY